jgi:hypothetical protein
MTLCEFKVQIDSISDYTWLKKEAKNLLKNTGYSNFDSVFNF